MNHTPDTKNKPLTTWEIARYLSVTPRTIQNWRDSGKIPFVRLSARCVRYNLEAVEKALALTQ